MVMKSPLISVVIPAFNEQNSIANCLSSLHQQTFLDFEIIVVDNNSTDKTEEIATQYGARVVREKKQGMIPARERGFKEARADIIARTDADAILPPDWLQCIYNVFKRNPRIVAVAGGHTFPEAGKLFNLPLSLLTKYIYFPFVRLIMGHYQLSGPNNAIRKSAWQKTTVHTDEKLIHEDIDLSCHLAELGEIQYHPEIEVPYSLRRLKNNPLYTIVEYTKRSVQTIFLHHPFLKRHKKSRW